MNVVNSVPNLVSNICEYPVNPTNFVEYCLCLHQNIRSMRKNFSILLAHIESLVNLPVVIVLSEIWIYENELSLYNIPGYTLFGNCNNSYSAGGVICYVKDGCVCDCSNLKLSSADVM